VCSERDRVIWMCARRFVVTELLCLLSKECYETLVRRREGYVCR